MKRRQTPEKWKFTGEGLEGKLVRRVAVDSSGTWISSKIMLLLWPHRKAVVNSASDISRILFQCLDYSIKFHLHPSSKTN